MGAPAMGPPRTLGDASWAPLGTPGHHSAPLCTHRSTGKGGGYTSRVPQPGFGIRVPGSGIPDPEFEIRDPGFGVRVPGSGIPNPESGIRDSGSGIRDPGIRISGIRIRSERCGQIEATDHERFGWTRMQKKTTDR